MLRGIKFRTNSKTRALVLAAMMGGLIFVGGLIRIPLGPLPFTLQTLFVLLSGMLLEPSGALSATLLHLLLKLVFGGASSVLSPSFGFVLAFIPAAYVLSCLNKLRGRNVFEKAVNVAMASLLLYLIGLPYMALILRCISGQALTLQSILLSGMLVFLPGDALKAALALVLERRLRPVVVT